MNSRSRSRAAELAGEQADLATGAVEDRDRGAVPGRAGPVRGDAAHRRGVDGGPVRIDRDRGEVGRRRPVADRLRASPRRRRTPRSSRRRRPRPPTPSAKIRRTVRARHDAGWRKILASADGAISVADPAAERGQPVRPARASTTAASPWPVVTAAVAKSKRVIVRPDRDSRGRAHPRSAWSAWHPPRSRRAAARSCRSSCRRRRPARPSSRPKRRPTEPCSSVTLVDRAGVELAAVGTRRRAGGHEAGPRLARTDDAVDERGRPMVRPDGGVGSFGSSTYQKLDSRIVLPSARRTRPGRLASAAARPTETGSSSVTAWELVTSSVARSRTSTPITHPAAPSRRLQPMSAYRPSGEAADARVDELRLHRFRLGRVVGTVEFLQHRRLARRSGRIDRLEREPKAVRPHRRPSCVHSPQTQTQPPPGRAEHGRWPVVGRDQSRPERRRSPGRRSRTRRPS